MVTSFVSNRSFQRLKFGGVVTACKRSFASKEIWFGPACIASVAYIDPGNFAANIASGAKCGYSLLWILLWGNVIGFLVQTLACRLGIFTDACLATNCRRTMPRPLLVPLWITSELMSVATDLAEVLGAGIGITLVFHTPLLPSCLVAGLLSFLPFLRKREDQKFLERLMSLLVFCIGCAFAYELFVVKPDWSMVAKGTLVPTMRSDDLLIAASMLGATVMPHAVFLHSGLIRSYKKEIAPDERYRLAIADNFCALNFAWLINAAMVITFAALYKGAAVDAPSIEVATRAMAPMFGQLSALILGLALIISGLGSTTVGSLAGQAILDGFFNINLPLWCRRAITLLPCLLIIQTGFDTTKLLVLSQAALSIALPFTIVPLIWLNSSSKLMGPRRMHGNMLACSIFAAALIVLLNICLIVNLFRTGFAA